MKQQFIDWFTRGNNGYPPALNADGDFEHEKTRHMWEAYQAGATEQLEQVRLLTEQRDAVVAENVALKSGVTYFACGSEYGFDLFNNKQDAIDTALGEIDIHREGYLDGGDGWDDEVKRTAWGIVIQSAQGYDAQGKHTSDSQHTYQTCDYRLVDEVKTPATSSAIAALRAEASADAFSLAEDLVRNEIACLKERSPTLKEMACLANTFHVMANQLRESKGEVQS